MKVIKNIENMNLDELLEVENKIVIPSKYTISDSLTYLPILLFHSGSFVVNSFYLINSFHPVSAIAIAGSLGVLIAFGPKLFHNLKAIKHSPFNYYLFNKDNYDKYRSTTPIRKELTRLYNILINDLLNEIDNSSINDDPLSISILLGDFLIPNGYLSYTNRFHSTNSGDLFNPSFSYTQTVNLEGLYVIAGYGCCRHVNSFVADVLAIKGIKSDKIGCVHGSTSFLKDRINNLDFSSNHLIVGYIDNNEYHLVDPFNSRYSYTSFEDYYLDNYNCHGMIPVFEKNHFQQELNYNPYLKENIFNSEQVGIKQSQIFMAMMNGEDERFRRFKESHFEIYEKIAYLTPIELNRCQEKEKQKLKRI